MPDYEDLTPESAAIATILRHITEVRSAILRIRHELEARAERHDVSKWSPEELPGFARINATAREHPYGSEEYKAAIRSEKPTVERHQRGNSHHPEHHEELAAMGWLDIVEMVCDWWAASRTYGTTPWRDVLTRQRERWAWSREQWWLILQVATWLSGEDLSSLEGAERSDDGGILHTAWVEEAGKRLPTKAAGRLRPGDHYWRAGRVWEVVGVKSVGKAILFLATDGSETINVNLAALARIPMHYDTEAPR